MFNPARKDLTLSTATATTAADLTVPEIGGHHHFLLRRLHSLTGLVFGGYLVIHLIVNATLAQGVREGEPSIFQEQVNKIHSLPFLMAVEWLLIYIPIIYHTIYGVWITATGQPNVGQYRYSKNWFYFFQRVSAIIIVAFMIFHILGMKGVFGTNLEFVPEKYALESVKWHFQRSWMVLYLIYPIGVLASCYHLANGIWTAAITWGLTVSEQAQRRWGYVCFGLFLLTLLCGILALYGVMRINPVSSPVWLKG
jgi:succinate dehydrogenase / fumarate reductase cytochrome b subunit